MKKVFTILTGLILLTGCEDNTSTEEVEVAPVVAKDSLSTIEGEFIYLADAAVLKGSNFIYGVELDSISLKLADSIEPLKRDEFDMVKVKVRGKIIQNPGREGWEELVQIREILKITPAPSTGAAPKVEKDIDKP